MNTCFDCLKDYPSNETEWTKEGYICEWCKNGFIPPQENEKNWA